MASRCWVDDGHMDLAAIPIGDVLGGGDFPNCEPLLDAFQVVLEPVGYQNGLAICGLDQILQSIQFAAMQFQVVAILAIDGTISHLGQLASQCGGISSVDFLALERDHKIRLHGVVGLAFFFGKGDLYLVHHAIGHIQMVNGLHGNGDVGNGIVYAILGTGERFVGEHHLSVPLVGLEVGVSVMGDEATEPLA